MDIGTLTGHITIESEVAGHLDEISHKAKEFVDSLEGSFGAAAKAVGVLTAAIVGLTGSIVALGEKGSTILGVENAFDHLAERVSTTGEALSGALSEGVKETVDQFELMKDTSKLLGSGMKLTTDQALLMGQAARELGKATGGDATSGLEIMSSALTTGRVRGLQQQIGLIDLKKGEEDFAKSLGVTVDQLNEEGKLEGKRIAILAATQAYVDRLGVSQLSFKEKLLQGKVAVEEWFDSLAKSVASSPAVMGALNAIGDAIQKTFGGVGQTTLETIIGLIESFANTVAKYGPSIVELFGNIASGVKSVFVFIKDYTPLVSIVETLLKPFKELADALKQFEDSLHGVSSAAKETGGPITSVTDGTGKLLLNSEQVAARLAAQGKQLQIVSGLTADFKNNTLFLTDEQKKQEFTTSKLTEEQKKYAESLKNVMSFATPWQETLKTIDTLTAAAATEELKHGASLKDVIEVWHLTEGQGKALEDQIKFLGSATTATTKAFATQGGYIASAIVPIYSEFHDQLTGINNVTGELAGRFFDSGTATFGFANAEDYAKKKTEELRKTLDELNQQTLKEGLLKDLQDIPMMLERAFTGGGGFLGGVEAIGTKIGATIGKSIGSAVSSLGKLGGPIGEAVGSLVGPLIDLFANIGGPSKEELAARDAFKAVQQKGESLNQTIQRLADSLMEAGKSGPEALAMIQRALDATHSSADGVNAAIDAINGTISDYKQDQADLNAAVQKYGFTIEELGPKMQKQQLDDQAKQLIRDWTLLVESGIQVATVNDRMASSIQDYLKNARLTGQEVPEAMKPIIQKLIDQGDLTDEAGNKITDMKQLGVSFAESMSKGFDKVVSRLDKLLEGLGLIPKALDQIDGKTVEFDIQGHYTPPDLPPGAETFQNPYGAAQGGYVTPSGISYYGTGGKVLPFAPRGTDTVPAMLTPGESVQSVSDVKSTSENLRILADEQMAQSASLKNIERILKDNPRATGVAVADAMLLTPRRTA